MKNILLCVATLMAFVAGVNAQSLKERALVYKYVVNDKAPGVHTTIKNGVKIWTNSNGDNLGEYKYSVTVSEKKEADKIRAQAIDEISKKSLSKIDRKEANKAVIADVDRDGEITSWDAYRILVYSVGLITEF